MLYLLYIGYIYNITCSVILYINIIGKVIVTYSYVSVITSLIQLTSLTPVSLSDSWFCDCIVYRSLLENVLYQCRNKLSLSGKALW